MKRKNIALTLGKNTILSVLQQYPLIAGLIATIDEENKDLVFEKINYLEDKLKEINFSIEKLTYLIDDSAKYIHIKNFLSFYFTKTDPALVETNIKIFLDYVSEKQNNNGYDILLEKICLLSRESLNVVKKIKSIVKDENYYEWSEFLKLYTNIDQTLSYRDILTSKELNGELLEISFGLKSLIENDFIISLSANYPGNIDIYDIDKFSITNIGYLLLEYV